MSRPTPTYATLDDWIAREATPFSVDSPTTFNAAVDKVIASLGDAVELLGFGEALHGGEDILILRNRLFQRLVEAHGYSAIAIESSFPRARVVNEYVAGRGPASYEAVQDTGFSHGFGRYDRHIAASASCCRCGPAGVARRPLPIAPVPLSHPSCPLTRRLARGGASGAARVRCRHTHGPHSHPCPQPLQPHPAPPRGPGPQAVQGRVQRL